MPRASKRLITAEDLYNFEIIKNARLSPDGKQVVYSLSRVERKTEKKYANLWIVPTGGGSPRQFTYGIQNDSSPLWSPDGQSIAFLSNRGSSEKPSQIYLIPFHGGEARQIADIKGEISSLSWSPDGKRLLCVVRKTDPDELERQQDEQKKKLGVVSRRYDRLFYKLDGYGYLPQERRHIWIVDFHSGKTHQLTEHKIFDEDYPSWSPDGKWVVFTSNHSPDPDLKPEAVDLFVMPAEGGDLRMLPTIFGVKFYAQFFTGWKMDCILWQRRRGYGL